MTQLLADFVERPPAISSSARLRRWPHEMSLSRDHFMASGGPVSEVAEGFEAVPEAALGQFTSANRGRKLVRIAEED